MYVADIQRFAPKPWVRPLSACLPQPGSTLQSTVLCDGDVRWISQMEDDGEIFACGITGDGVAFVSSVIAGHLDKTVFLSVNWDNADATADDGTSAGSSSMRRVLSMGLTRDGTRAATGHVYGAVLLWDVETGELVGDGLYPVLNEIRSVLSVAFSADGKRVGWIAEDGTLRVRDVETGESIDVLRGHNFVGGVALSADGSLVASGSRDSSVRVLDVKTGDLVGDALQGTVATFRSLRSRRTASAWYLDQRTQPCECGIWRRGSLWAMHCVGTVAALELLRSLQTGRAWHPDHGTGQCECGMWRPGKPRAMLFGTTSR